MDNSHAFIDNNLSPFQSSFPDKPYIRGIRGSQALKFVRRIPIQTMTFKHLVIAQARGLGTPVLREKSLLMH